MTSAASKNPAETMSARPVFSYAQAAKGRVTSNPTTVPPHPSQNVTDIGGASKDTSATASTFSTSTNGSVGEMESGDHNVTQGLDVNIKADNLKPTLESESKSPMISSSMSLPASPSFEASSSPTLPKEDDHRSREEGMNAFAWNHNNSLPMVTPEKHSEAAEARKGKKQKKQKNSEKVAEPEKPEIKPETLVAAPVPVVNIWQQRKEAQAAKAKRSPLMIQGLVSEGGASKSIDSDTKQATKLVDAKNGGKSSPAEDEKTAGPAQDPKKKNSESKLKEEISTKKTPSRGSRLSEKDQKSSIIQVPPPVDAISWPTPDTAMVEERRRSQDKPEKEDGEESTSNRPRQKKEWVSVPFTPSVTFDTPLPPGRGRGRGGMRMSRDAAGRSGHTANANMPGEKLASGAIKPTELGEAEKRGRGETGVRATSLPPNSTKRLSTNATAFNMRDPRKPGAPSMDRSKAGSNSNAAKNDLNPSTIGRRTSTATQTDPTMETASIQSDNGKARPDQQQTGYQAFGNNQVDRRNESNWKGVDPMSKEGPIVGKDSHQGRDKAESRQDRGRGAFRGRGLNNYMNSQQHPQHTFASGQGSQPTNAFSLRENAGPYSPPLQQPFSHQFAPSPARGRGGSRSQSIPNNTIFSRLPPNSTATSQQMTPLQTSTPVFDYPPMQTMSAVSYNPYIDQYSVLAMVTMQLEYYFSIDNLCKDVFLRKHMDSQGFVFLTFIAGFKRIQALTHDFELLRFACQESGVVEVFRGDDGIDRLRRKDGWEKWVLAMEERDESTRNAGPTYIHRQFPNQRAQQMGQMIMSGPHSISPQAFSPNGNEGVFQPFGNGVSVTSSVNGNGHSHHPETPLSAAVPDFSPGLLPLESTPDPLEPETIFTDAEVEHLTLVFTKGSEDARAKQAIRNMQSRTFSNGSIDGRSISEDMQDQQQGTTASNMSRASETSPESLRRSKSPFTSLSPKSNASNGPPIMWVKGQKHQRALSDNNEQERYVDVRQKALDRRESASAGETPRDMKYLYEFWSHFLCRNFNPKMYSEFRKYALEDAKQNSNVGVTNLIAYYDEILNSRKKTIPETLARHYVELVKAEESKTERPGLAKLRASWRNGALDLKSRKKIDSLVDRKLRDELER